MVLVDSSVWISYFKNTSESQLTTLIVEDLVVTNDIVLSELIPHAEHKGEKALVECLKAIPIIPLDIDWEGLRLLQILNLQNGVNKVGIPDLVITQQVIHNKIQLWSLDKHFGLMNNYMNFDLLKD